jgi:hypothetical protein
MTKAATILLRVGGALACLGLVIGVGGVIWSFNQVASIGVDQPTHLAYGITGVLVGMPILMVGVLTMLIAVILQFATKSKPTTSS